ncbi:MAG: hypothetical protein ACRDOI_16805 [Trebonia sp.]
MAAPLVVGAIDQVSGVLAPRLSVAPNCTLLAVGTWTAAEPTTDVAGVPNVAVMLLTWATLTWDAATEVSA